MTARRTGDRPARPENLTRTKIPGGEATWWKPEELPQWKEREISIASMQINKVKLRALQNAKAVIEDDKSIPTAEEISEGELAVLTEKEARALVGMTDIAIWVYLKGWTLTELVKDTNADGNEITVKVPVPLPETAEEVKFLPRNLYMALAENADIIITRTKVLNESFAPNGDDDSPTTD
jgi:hypothetical protein